MDKTTIHQKVPNWQKFKTFLYQYVMIVSFNVHLYMLLCDMFIFCTMYGMLHLNCIKFKVGVNPSLKREMWLLMDLVTKKTCAKMYKSIHFWNQKNQMNPMVATDFCKIMRFSRNSSVTMVTIEFFLDSITKIWFY